MAGCSLQCKWKFLCRLTVQARTGKEKPGTGQLCFLHDRRIRTPWQDEYDSLFDLAATTRLLLLVCSLLQRRPLFFEYFCFGGSLWPRQTNMVFGLVLVAPTDD